MALWRLTEPLILASRSPARRDAAAGCRHPVRGPCRPTSTSARSTALADGAGAGAAIALAAAKALAVAPAPPGRLVLGADQTLSLGRRPYPQGRRPSPKPRADPGAFARARHIISTARRPWRGTATCCGAVSTAPSSTMRPFDDRFLDRYLDAVGPVRHRNGRRLSARRARHPAVRARSTATTSPFSACRSCRCWRRCAIAGASWSADRWNRAPASSASRWRIRARR